MAGLLSGLMGGLRGAAGQAGGLLDDVGGKVQRGLYGTTPEAAVTEHADTSNSGFGPLRQAPSINLTGQNTDGLLSKLGTPDGRGLTFGDKLFAAGSVLQGDSGGAAAYLANQRGTADAMGERKRQQDMARLGQEAFRGAIMPDGKFNFKGYVDALGSQGDPKSALAMRDAMRPNLTPMSGARGAVNVFDRDTGDVREALAATPLTPEEIEEKRVAIAKDRAMTDYYGIRNQQLPFDSQTRRITATRPPASRAAPKGGTAPPPRAGWRRIPGASH